MNDSWANRLLNDRYQIQAQLGEGGMGSVLLAHDLRLDTSVVVKIPHRTLLHEEGFKERFQREIRSLVRLRHPHIVSILDVGEEDSVPYAVMQHLGGGSLGAHRKRLEKLSVMERAHSLRFWLPSIASALDFMHAQGFVHRDIKPANILFDENGNAFLSDFGIAKVMAQAEEKKRQMSLTGTGIAMGTPEYMAPELCDGKTIDQKVDQYALAVTVFEMMVGKCPLVGQTPLATIVMHKTHVAPKLNQIVREIPGPFSETVARAMSKNPEQRFASCMEFSTALIDSLLDGPATATPVHLMEADTVADAQSARTPAYGGNASSPTSAPAHGSNPASASAPPSPIASVPARSFQQPAAVDGMARLACPRCSQVVKIPPNPALVGRRATCPHCRSSLIIQPNELLLAPDPSQQPSAALAGNSPIGGASIAHPANSPAVNPLHGNLENVAHVGTSAPRSSSTAGRLIGLAVGLLLLFGLLVPVAYGGYRWWSWRSTEMAELAEDIAGCERMLANNLSTAEYLKAHATDRIEDWRYWARAGNASAQVLMGDCYLEGIGTEKDPNEFFRYNELAAKQGHPLGKWSLGLAYHRGYGVAADAAKAESLWRELAEKEYPTALNTLAVGMLVDGNVPDDKKTEFLALVKQGAELEHANCQYWLGFCYQYGIGVTRSIPEAIVWYQRSADNGYAKAAERVKALKL